MLRRAGWRATRAASGAGWGWVCRQTRCQSAGPALVRVNSHLAFKWFACPHCLPVLYVDNTWDPIYASCESPDEPESTEPALPPKASSGKKGKGGGSRSRKSGGGDASDTARARGGSAKKGAVTTDMNGASPADADHAAAATGAKRKRADTGPVNAAETTSTTASTSSSSVLGGSPAPAPAPASAQPPAKKARGKAAETIASRFPPGSPEHTFWMGLELTWDDLGLHVRQHAMLVIAYSLSSIIAGTFA
jgi:hypothetical protein